LRSCVVVLLCCCVVVLLCCCVVVLLCCCVVALLCCCVVVLLCCCVVVLLCCCVVCGVWCSFFNRFGLVIWTCFFVGLFILLACFLTCCCGCIFHSCFFPDDIKFHQVRHGAIASLHAFVSRGDVSSAGLPSSTLSEMKQIMRLLRNDGDPETAHKAGLTALLLEQMESGV
jgi:hypothetical protein